VDELDRAQVRRAGRDRHRLVRRRLEILEIAADLLRGRRQRELVELFRVLEILRALDDAHRAHFVAGSLARDDQLDGEAGRDLGDAVVQERYRDSRLATRYRADGPRTRTGIAVRVLVHALEELERLVLAEDLHERRERRICRAGGIRIRHLNLVFVDRIREVGPALRRW